MAQRHIGWTVMAAAIFLAGCNNDLTIPPQSPPAVPPAPPPLTTNSYTLTSANRLIGFNAATADQDIVDLDLTGLAAGETVAAIAFRPFDGELYALITAGTTARVAIVDATTGAVDAGIALTADTTDTTAPFAGVSGTRFGADFNPVPDRLRVVSDTGQNLRINVDTGATITDTALNGAATGAVNAAYTNSFNAACRTQLFAVDTASGNLLLQNPPNDGVLSVVGSLGIDATAVNGFDVQTLADGSNTAFAVLTVDEGTPAVATTRLYTINTTTGAATAGAVISLEAGETPVGFASRPLPVDTEVAQAPGELLALTMRATVEETEDDDEVPGSANVLATFQRGSPGKLCSTADISDVTVNPDFPATTTLLGLDTQPATGTVVALGSDSTLYTVDPDGTTTALCPLLPDPTDLTAPFTALPADVTFGVGFNPVPDRLRVTGSNGLNLRINANPNAAGACLVITDTNLTAGATVTGAAYVNAIPAAGVTALFGIDSATGALVRIGSDPANGTAGDPGNPNSGVVNTIGSLAITGGVAAANGFVIDGRNNMALAALTVGTAETSTLYSVNLATGAATSTGTIGGALDTVSIEPVRGLALTGGTTLNVYALTTDDHLLSFTQTANALQPNTVTDLTITGLSSGETLVGVDFRPANGLLYAVSTLGRVYTVNTSTGLVTLSSTLAADATDTTAPFTSLAAGQTFGIDFNPVPDRLRVVDTAGNNLRVNVATGATITDGTLNGPVTSVQAAAYANNFAGTTTTVLYDLDATTLYTQTPPNDGTLVAVGPTGVTATGDVGFDISGGANGLVLAAIRSEAGAGPSSLYRVNLTTGAATLLAQPGGTAVIGATTNAQVRSIAIDAR